MESQDASTAYLSSEGRYTLFDFAGKRLTIIAPKPLERYLSVTEWDRGYLVVQAKYATSDEPMEEYIDLAPTLEELYIDKSFLDPIERVEVSYA